MQAGAVQHEREECRGMEEGIRDDGTRAIVVGDKRLEVRRRKPWECDFGALEWQVPPSTVQVHTYFSFHVSPRM
jgi:hypothetical protein